MPSNEEIVRSAYHAAEGDVLDLKGWRNSFTEDGVFNMIPTGQSYTGEHLTDVVTRPRRPSSRIRIASCCG
jgi:hypothetical protein